MLLGRWSRSAVLGENVLQAGLQLCSIDRCTSGHHPQICYVLRRTCTEIALSSSSSWTPSTPFLRPCRVAGSGVSGRGEYVRNSSMSRFMSIKTPQRDLEIRGKYPTAEVESVAAFAEREQGAWTRGVAVQTTPSGKGRRDRPCGGLAMSLALCWRYSPSSNLASNGHHGSHTGAAVVYRVSASETKGREGSIVQSACFYVYSRTY